MTTVASRGGYERQKLMFAFPWYLTPTHVRLACRRSHTHAPVRLHLNPMYFEGARLLRVMPFRKRVTSPKKEVNTLFWFLVITFGPSNHQYQIPESTDNDCLLNLSFAAALFSILLLS